MIDAHTALRTHLIEASALRTLLGGNYVYTPELPSTRTGDTKNVVFSVTGGQTDPYLRAQDLRVAFRCYGESSEEAREVYRALYDRLHDTQNFIVGDVGFHGAVEEVPGTPLEDPGTDWPYIFTVYSIRVATVPVGDGGS
jgi:hypothetical protein